MNAKAIISLKFHSKEQIDSIFKALKPETCSPASSRSKVKMIKEGNSLNLVFEAQDTSALRAAINSYLNWIRLTKEILKSLEMP